MKKSIKITAVLLSVLTVLLPLAILRGSAQQTCSWYCMREKNNRRPSCPPEFAYAENENFLWIDPTVTDTAGEKVAYLTFDAGYENGNVAKILDILDEKGVKGSFFILINLIDREPELVRRMTESGQLVCNHTAHHKDMSKITDRKKFNAELNALADAYRTLTGRQIAYFYRPPEGKFSGENLRMASDLGYTTVLWSFAYADWDNTAQADPEAAKEKILANIHNGCILLLHPTSETNVRILGTVIDEMKKDGYRFETLDKIGLSPEG